MVLEPMDPGIWGIDIDEANERETFRECMFRIQTGLVDGSMSFVL